MHKPTLLTIFLLLLLGISVASAQQYTLKGSSETWIITGEYNRELIRIDSKGRIQFKIWEFQNLTRSGFTCVLPLGVDEALIGTENDYAWYYNEGSIEKIATANGLCESHIQAISLSRNGKRIYIETDRNGYASKAGTYRHFACYTASDTNNGGADEALPRFRKRNILAFVTQPVRNLSREWLPYVADAVPEANSHRKLRREHALLIRSRIEPGDIILERKDGLLTNSVIPKFWTHSAIYIGSLQQLNAYFADLPLLNGASPAQYIKKHYPEAFRKMLRTRSPIIESVTKTGVSINPLKNVLEVDHFALLRTNLQPEDKFLALLKALEYYQLPYDFSFDLGEPDALSCSSLVYRSFVANCIKNGIEIPISTLMGSPMVYPGDFARKFDADNNVENRELNLILFFDSTPTSGITELRTAEEFRVSWKR